MVTAPSAPSRMRALSGALDQAFSSVSNGFIVYAVAVVASPQSFGHITILMTSLMAVLSCFRGGFGIPLLLKADQPIDAVRREGAFALAAVLVIGPLASIAILLLTPRLDAAAVALAVSAPFVLAQDVLRYVAMAAGRPHIAALWDGIWCVGTLVVLVCSWIGFQFINAGLVLGFWGLLALIAFVAMAIDLRLLPSVRGLYARYKPDWHHRLRYAADAGLEQIGLLLVFAITSMMVNAAATGALRGAIALLAPLLIAASAVQLVMIPESVRSSSPPLRVWQNMRKVMSALAAIAVVAGIVYTILPHRVGAFLLGESFASAQRVIPYMTAQFIAAAVTFAILVYLRTFNRSADVLRIKIIYLAAITTAAVIAAYWTGSAVGVSIGLAVASTLVAIIAFVTVSPGRRHVSATAQSSQPPQEIITAAGDLPDSLAPPVAALPPSRPSMPLVAPAESASADARSGDRPKARLAGSSQAQIVNRRLLGWSAIAMASLVMVIWWSTTRRDSAV